MEYAYETETEINENYFLWSAINLIISIVFGTLLVLPFSIYVFLQARKYRFFITKAQSKRILKWNIIVSILIALSVIAGITLAIIISLNKAGVF